MRKVIVNTVQTSSGTAFNVFESQGTTNKLVTRDAADGVFKDAVIPKDTKVEHVGALGTAAVSFDFPLRKADNSLKSNFTFDININHDAMLTSPVGGSARELRFKVKDSGGSFLTVDSSYSRASGFDNSFSGNTTADGTTRQYAPIRTRYQNGGVFNCIFTADVNFFVDPSNSARHYLSIRYSGHVGNSGSSSGIGVVNGFAWVRFSSGTPATLVLETDAQSGNNEESFFLNNITGFLS
tara:strand:- start:5405 stop:6121 length:717 start_codon:yes stop_codon:yes gene_type:complete